MFGLFGKRGRKPVDDAQRIIPQQIWDSEIGQALRDAGLGPDDAANILPMHPVDARIAKARLAHENRLAEENASLSRRHPGCTLATQFILSNDVWNGRHVELLLYTLELTPFDAFNVRLLPADAYSAGVLSQPYAYRGQFDEVTRASEAHIAEIMVRAGLTDSAGATADGKAQARRELAGLTNYYYEEHILPALRSAI